MYLPHDPHEIPDIDTNWTVVKGPKGDLKNGGWDSLIGVVTAICGNVLISFALNTQRYAHMRLSKDREQRLQEKRKRRRKVSQYGTHQAEHSDETARQNAKSESNGYTIERSEQSGETEPLIPRVHSRHESGSSSSDMAEACDDDEDPKEKSYLKSPIWWVGIAMMVVGEIGNFLAYGFAPASIVAPLGVVALVSNCLIAPLLLREKFRWRDGLGVLIASGGAVVVVLSASSSNPKLTPEAIWGLVTTWEFETYLGITLFLIVALVFLSNKFGEKTILIDLGLVALFGGYTALSTKGVASLLTYSIWRVVTFPITYLLLAVLIGTAVMQIKYVNRALQRFNSTMVIPTQFVLFTISVILGSAVLYRDFEREQTDDAIKFVAGCAMTFFGVWCITSGRKRNQDGDVDDDEDDAISLADEENAEVRERDGSERQASVVTASSGRATVRRIHTADGNIAGSLGKTPTFAPVEAATPPAPFNLNKHLQEADMAPANASAVHADSTAPLNGSDGSRVNPVKPPPIHATTSAPIVPQTPKPDDALLRPKTPARTPSGPPIDSPSKMTSAQKAQHLDPNVTPRQKLQQRHSVLGIVPGPLTSPLSGSLAAIVADELRRGVERSPLGSIGRRRSAKTNRPSISQDEDPYQPVISSSLKRHSIASGDIDFDSEEAANLRVAAGSPTGGRMRSLSATISDMLGGASNSLKRQRTLDKQAKRKQSTNDENTEERDSER
ncbi:NIPA-like protein 2 [Pseudocercospora fuligena]|uniref:NIPA-like protein 2 n=1 Tax=Pseudocercospora fuligena TaxID=685502 RepID=A0A8H6RJS6_9PEZI|nr:NIPA-like protein 2 [Pseudocercospora fuligena]